MIHKNWQEKQVDPEWVKDETARINAVVDKFGMAMKARLAEKVCEGRTGWSDKSSSDEIYNAMLAHAASTKLAHEREIDVANFAMMLWNLRTNS